MPPRKNPAAESDKAAKKARTDADQQAAAAAGPAATTTGQQQQQPGAVGAGSGILPTIGQDFLDFVDEISDSIESSRRTPIFNYQFSNGLGRGTVLIGGKGIAKRFLGALRAKGLNVGDRSCASLVDENMDACFRNVSDSHPGVVVLTEMEQLSRALQKRVSHRVAALQEGGFFVVTVGVTENGNYALSPELTSSFRIKVLTEVESPAV